MNSRYQAFTLILASSLLILILYLYFPIGFKPVDYPQKTEPKGISLLKRLFNKKPQDSTWELIVTGDIMLGRTVMTTSLDKDDPVYPFRKVADRLYKADLVFANLENPVVTNCPRHTDGFKFCSDPKMLDGLTFSGIDIVTLANNHTGNYGKKGLEETVNFLNQKGITHTNEQLTIKKVNNLTVGFIGFNLVDKKEIEEEKLKLVREAKTQVDLLIVSPHWGYEYQNQASVYQKNIAQKLVENGADIVVGHHPHWVQNTETIDGKPVYYSLGNFIFDQMWSEKTRQGMAVKFTFEGSNLIKQEPMFIYMHDWAQPEWQDTR